MSPFARTFGLLGVAFLSPAVLITAQHCFESRECPSFGDETNLMQTQPTFPISRVAPAKRANAPANAPAKRRMSTLHLEVVARRMAAVARRMAEVARQRKKKKKATLAPIIHIEGVDSEEHKAEKLLQHLSEEKTNLIRSGGTTSWVIPRDEPECQLGPAAAFQVEDNSDDYGVGCEVVSPESNIMLESWTQDMSEGNGTTSLDGQCSYKMRGNCKRFIIQGCEFWGKGECCGRRIPAEIPKTLSEPIEGEAQLSVTELNAMSKVFTDCKERPVYWNSDPTLANHGPWEPKLWVGSLGAESHFHFIQNEIGVQDFYNLKDFNADQMKLIVDVGANIGWFSIAACLRFPDARIVAFEPHPENYRFLLQNLERNGCAGKVQAVNRGLSRDGRGVRLSWLQSGGNSAYIGVDNNHSITMQTITPSELWSEYLDEGTGDDPIVSFMKVDCEGCEYEFLPLVPSSKVTAIRCETHPGLASIANATEEVANSVNKACEQGSLELLQAGKPRSLPDPEGKPRSLEDLYGASIHPEKTSQFSSGVPI